MATLTERLAAISAAEEKVKRDNPISVVYPIRSGTKDLKTQWQIGGKAVANKKVARQPLQIFKGKEFLDNVNKPVTTVTAKMVKVQRVPKIFNLDKTKYVNEVTVNKVIGMVLMGGAGIKSAEGSEETLNETKLVNMNYLAEDV